MKNQLGSIQISTSKFDSNQLHLDCFDQDNTFIDGILTCMEDTVKPGRKIKITEMYEGKKYSYLFEINKIIKVSNSKYCCLEFIKNKTYTYLPSILGYTDVELLYKSDTGKKKEIPNYLLNAYLDSNKQYIYLAYRFYPYKFYSNFAEHLKANRFFKEQLVVDQLDYFKFKIPEHFLKDVDKFLEGKYHKMSNDYKESLQVFYDGLPKESRLHQVVHNDIQLRNDLSEMFKVTLTDNVGLDNRPILEKEILTN